MSWRRLGNVESEKLICYKIALRGVSSRVLAKKRQVAVDHCREEVAIRNVVGAFLVIGGARNCGIDLAEQASSEFEMDERQLDARSRDFGTVVRTKISAIIAPPDQRDLMNRAEEGFLFDSGQFSQMLPYDPEERLLVASAHRNIVLSHQAITDAAINALKAIPAGYPVPVPSIVEKRISS